MTLGKIKGKRRRGRQRMRWLDSISDSMDMNISKLWEMVKDKEAWHATVHGIVKSQTWLSDWITTSWAQAQEPHTRLTWHLYYVNPHKSSDTSSSLQGLFPGNCPPGKFRQHPYSHETRNNPSELVSNRLEKCSCEHGHSTALSNEKRYWHGIWDTHQARFWKKEKYISTVISRRNY